MALRSRAFWRSVRLSSPESSATTSAFALRPLVFLPSSAASPSCTASAGAAALDLPLPFGEATSGSSALPFLAGTSLLVFAATAVFFVSLLGFATGFALAAAFAAGLPAFAIGFTGLAGFLTAFARTFATGFAAFFATGFADLAIGLADLATGFFTAFAGAAAFLGAALDAGFDFTATAFLAGALAFAGVAAFFAGAFAATLLFAGAVVFLASGLDLLAGVFFTGFALFLIVLLGIGLRSLT